MNPSFAIASIIAALLLIAMSPIFDDLWRQDASRMIQMTGLSDVHVEGQMEQTYRVGCFLAGSLLLAVSVFGFSSRRNGKRVGPDRDFV